MTARGAMPAQAQRLLRVGNEWRLELEQLVYSSSHLLRPRRSEVRGEHAILHRLRSLGDGELLVREAERLFRTAPTSVDVAFVAQDSSWVPDVQEQVLASAPSEDGAELQQARRKAERYAKRVTALEATVRTLQEALKSQSQAQVAARQSASQQDEAAEAPPEPNEGAPPRGWGEEEVQAPTQEIRALGSFAPKPVRIAEPEVPKLAHSMSLPSAEGLGELLKGLGGAGANVYPVDDASWMQTGDVYVCMLRTDDDQDCAALVFDFECAVRLASALLMESDENVRDILEQREMSADMLDAASEVGNTLASVFNKVSGNRHVRAGRVATADDAARAFVGTAGERQCYRYAPGGLMGLCAH